MAEKKSVERARDVDQAPRSEHSENPVWFKPLMLGFMVIGLLWIIVYYIGAGSVSFSIPIPGIDSWNIAVGFGIALIGFLMTTRWK